VSALECLAKQETPPNLPWEVIIVDNCCTDGTDEIAKAYWSQINKVPLRVIKENIPGLSAARATGIQNAHYEIVSFIDDDNLVATNWVALVYEIMNDNSHVAACGGRSDAQLTVDSPAWFDQFQNYYAVGAQGTNTGDLPTGRALWGAGLSLRKSVWLELQSKKFEFNLTDRKGDLPSTCGDTELCLAMSVLGWRLRYDHRLRLIHVISTDRLALGYLRERLRGCGAASVLLDGYFRALQPAGESKARKLADFWAWQMMTALVVWFYNCIRIQLLRWRDKDRVFTSSEFLRRLPVCELCYGRWRELLRLGKKYSGYLHGVERILGTSSLSCTE
jgi:glycosyltransferase involved in cell wall biosynthesis